MYSLSSKFPTFIIANAISMKTLNINKVFAIGVFSLFFMLGTIDAKAYDFGPDSISVISFSVFPNPAHDRLFLEFDAESFDIEDEFGQFEYSIGNVIGKKKKSGKTTRKALFQSGNRLEIQTVDLTPGIYLITVTQGSTSTTQRFIKK